MPSTSPKPLHILEKTRGRTLRVWMGPQIIEVVRDFLERYEERIQLMYAIKLADSVQERDRLDKDLSACENMLSELGQNYGYELLVLLAYELDLADEIEFSRASSDS